MTEALFDFVALSATSLEEYFLGLLRRSLRSLLAMTRGKSKNGRSRFYEP